VPASRSREPRGRDEADRVESDTPHNLQPSRDTLPGRRLIEGQELAFAERASPAAQLIAPPARKALLIVSDTMEEDLCA
jgi:hypothetical protein